jgi:hypothetical protein
VEQELLTLPDHLSSPPVFSGVRVTRSLVLYVCLVDRCLSFWPLCCLFFFDIRILIAPLVSSNSSFKHPIDLIFLILKIYGLQVLFFQNKTSGFIDDGLEVIFKDI